MHSFRANDPRPQESLSTWLEMSAPENSELVLRLSIFVGAFIIFAGLEAAFPRRQRAHLRIRRWPGNIGISFIAQLFVRLLVPVSAIAIAAYAATNNSGLLNQIELPRWVEVVAGVLLLDLVIYAQHVVFHAVPILWRCHRMHHSDTDIDTSTAIRFHPLEIVMSAFLKLAAVYLLGVSAFAVLLFEILLNASAMFNHSNLRIPVAIDQVLRLFIVTPDMHRVHHSVIPKETNSNFGFNFPWWDRLFRTYQAQPVDGHTEMRIGLEEFRDARELRLDRLLTQPFRNSRDWHSRTSDKS